MKISTFIYALLFIGVIVFVVALSVSDAETYYGEDINTTLIDGQYDYASDINESVYPIQESINKISDQDQGWLSKVGAGFTGIISAVVLLPKLVWSLFTSGGSLITGGLSSLNVPQVIISTILIGLTVWGVIKLIEFFQRWNL